MKLNDPKLAKVGMKVVDTYYSRSDYSDCWGIGIIRKVLKTRIHIEFPHATRDFDKNVKVYDLTHYRNFTKHYDQRKKEFKNGY